MTPELRRLLRNAERALSSYAPARPATKYVRIEGEVMVVAACASCASTIRSGEHAPDCKWMRARTIVGAIRQELRRP